MTIKENWSEVTIAEYLAISKLRPQDYEMELDYDIQVLSILSGEPVETFYALPVVELPLLVGKLKFMGAQPQGRVKESYKINGKKYRISYDVGALSYIQYADLVTLLKDNQDNFNIHRILAVLLIEQGKEYNTEGFDIDSAAEEILNHFNIADALAIALFFSTLLNGLTRATRSYWERKMKRQIRKVKDPQTRGKLKELHRKITRFRRGGDGGSGATK